MSLHYLTIDESGIQRRFAFAGEQTLIDVLREHELETGINLPLPCGGKGICGGCAVRLTGVLAPPDAEEKASLARRFGEAGAEGMRLACRAVMCGDCILSLEGKNSRASYKEENLTSLSEPCCVAFDVGTTTIALRVVDDNGKAVYQKTEHNAQRTMGADVMTRIACCGSEGGLEKLRSTVCRQLERMMDEAAHILGLTQDYAACTAAGNTTMLSIIAGIDPTPLGVAPYRTTDTLGRQFALPQREDGSEGRGIYLLPCAGGFTGGDLVGCLAALEHFHPQLAATEGLLLCDLGTNGELALRCGDRWLVTSAAAGPALEGGSISCGSGAVSHAAAALYDTRIIHEDKSAEGEDKTAAAPTRRIQLSQDIAAEVIGGGTPRTLTGCAVIDLVAILLGRGIIDSGGCMECDSFALCEGLSLQRNDVRQLQLAKGAVAAAALCLMHRAYGGSEGQLSAVVTGGLGYRVNPSSMTAIGLLPCCPTENIRAIPSLALEGAVLCLDEEGRKLAEAVRARCEVVELGGDALFDELFIEQLQFPE
ncbi:MAG: DUF4445 domain-containing protein [Ruminococcaceae bacterium]|nr:DUF4445 domain-containing protein [Oscillospiraceae bacterium]